jgi:tetratricopeptide (TPR) repeat protein
MIVIMVAYSRLHAVRTAAILYFLVAGLLILAAGFFQIPLFNYLGYEFSAVMTLPAAFISGFLTISLFRLHRQFELTRELWMTAFFSYVVVNAILLLIPMAVLLLNAIAVKNCSLVRGIVYYLLLPYGTMLFCVPLAVLIATMFKHTRIVFTLLVLGLLMQIIAVTYLQPQLFAFNPILGYFPGLTYDEVLADLTPLVLYREFTLIASFLFSVLFLFVVTQFHPMRSLRENFRSIQFARKDAVLLIPAFIFAALLAYGHDQRGALGFERSDREVQAELGGVAWTKHFVLYYSRGSVTPHELSLLKAEAEYFYHTVAARLQEHLAENEKITVYLYPGPSTKQRLIGTANTEITKPWRKEIHILTSSFHEIFQHELVHAMAAGFGAPVVKASLRMGVNEGLAGAIDWPGEDLSLHQYAAGLQRDSLLTDVESLFGYTGFALQASSYAYTVTGSFVKFLIDRYGLSHLKTVFRTGNFEAEYAKPLKSLIAEWKEFLSTVDVADVTPGNIRVRYSQPPIFRRTCARVIAAQNIAASRALRNKEYAMAEKEYEWSYADASTVGALRGLFQSQLLQGKSADVLQRFKQLPEGSFYKNYPSILLLAGDAAWLSGDSELALHLNRMLLDMNYHSSYNEAAALRMLVVPSANSEKTYGPLFYGSLSDSLRRTWIASLERDPVQEPIIFFFAAAQESDSLAGKAATIWERAIPRLTDPVLRYAAATHAAAAYYRNGEFEKAKKMLWDAQNYTSSAFCRERLQELIERYDFVEGALQ